MGALTATFVRDTFLRGLALEDADGRPLDDGFITARAQAAVARFQRKYGVRLAPTAVKLGSLPLEGELRAGEELLPGVPVAAIEAHGGIDYNPDQSRGNEHFSMKLPVAPIREIRAAGLWMPGMHQPSRIPNDWIHWEPRSNRVRFYPGRSMTFPILLQSGVFARIVSGEKPIPHAWHFSYVAGYTDAELLGGDYDVLEALGRMTAIEVLVAGSMDANLAAGVTGKSVSVDGLSQSMNLIQNAQALKYQPLIAALQAELDEWEATYWARRAGVRLFKV